jgi:hypothetical protein
MAAPSRTSALGLERRSTAAPCLQNKSLPGSGERQVPLKHFMWPPAACAAWAIGRLSGAAAAPSDKAKAAAMLALTSTAVKGVCKRVGAAFAGGLVELAGAVLDEGGADRPVRAQLDRIAAPWAQASRRRRVRWGRALKRRRARDAQSQRAL